jgi:hypothetical protein
MPNARRTGPTPWKPITGISGPTALAVDFDAGHNRQAALAGIVRRLDQ